VARNLPIMRLTMNDGDEPETLSLDLDSMPMVDAEECEALTGWTRQQWLEALFQDRARAVKFFVYLSRKRAGDPVPFDGIDFDMGRMEWEADDPETGSAPADLGVPEGDGPFGPEAEQQPTPGE
jgi:hypothetical protein